MILAGATALSLGIRSADADSKAAQFQMASSPSFLACPPH